MNRLSILGLAVMLLAALPTMSAQQELSAPVSGQPAPPPDAAQYEKQLAQMQENMQKMQAEMDKIRQSKDPAERQRLMQEHMATMQSAMGTMHGMMQPGMHCGQMMESK